MGQWRSMQGQGSKEQQREAQRRSAADLLLALTTRAKRKLGAQEAQAGRQSADKAASRPARRALHERAVAAAQHPAGFALLAGAAAYASVRGGIKVFHLTRRFFLRRLLLDVCGALDRCGQIYWIDMGSLLGIHREGDLILHDNDVDLAVLDPDWPRLAVDLRQALPPGKYSLKMVTPQGQPQSSWIRVYCPLGMCDLFGAHLSPARGEGLDGGQGDRVYVDCGHGDAMHIDRRLVLPTARKPWRGVNVSVPHDVEGTLERRYGPGWRTPSYADKGADAVEGNKPYMRVLRGLARIGIRV